MLNAMATETLRIGGRPLVTFVDPPAGASAYLHTTYRHFLAPGDGGAVRVRFGTVEPEMIAFTLYPVTGS